MRDDDFDGLPPWEDDAFNDDDNEGENWKPNPTKDACKALYAQWNLVITFLRAALDSLEEPKEEGMIGKDYIEEFKGSVLGDAYKVAAKILSSEVGVYIIRMENAAIIRKNAQYIKISTNGFLADGLMHSAHRQVIRDEIDRFRDLFIVWVNSFEKDEIEDEWGLFV